MAAMAWETVRVRRVAWMRNDGLVSRESMGWPVVKWKSSTASGHLWEGPRPPWEGTVQEEVLRRRSQAGARQAGRGGGAGRKVRWRAAVPLDSPRRWGRALATLITPQSWETHS